MELILASASPRRREILSNLGAEYKILVPEFDERKFIDDMLLRGEISPREQTVLLAREKAARALAMLDDKQGKLALGVDTSVVVDDIILGKPRDEAEAVEMLMLLSGRSHRVISGYGLVTESGEQTGYDETFVYMRDFDRDEALRYVKNEYVLDKAGAYAIQGRASLFIEKIEGGYFNVVGLPVYKIARTLKTYGIDLI